MQTPGPNCSICWRIGAAVRSQSVQRALQSLIGCAWTILGAGTLDDDEWRMWWPLLQAALPRSGWWAAKRVEGNGADIDGRTRRQPSTRTLQGLLPT
jgi:hypothetical protein